MGLGNSLIRIVTQVHIRLLIVDAQFARLAVQRVSAQTNA